MRILLALRMTPTFSGKMITCNFDELYQTYIRGLEHLYGRLHSHLSALGTILLPSPNGLLHETTRIPNFVKAQNSSLFYTLADFARYPTCATEQTTKVCYLRPHSRIELLEYVCYVRGLHRGTIHQLGIGGEKDFFIFFSLTFYIYYIINFVFRQIFVRAKLPLQDP